MEISILQRPVEGELVSTENVEHARQILKLEHIPLSPCPRRERSNHPTRGLVVASDLLHPVADMEDHLLSPVNSLAQVCGPQMPSGVKPCCFWNSLSASSRC